MTLEISGLAGHGAHYGWHGQNRSESRVSRDFLRIITMEHGEFAMGNRDEEEKLHLSADQLVIEVHNAPEP